MITKDKKRKIVEELLENITKAKAIYFTAFSGLDVSKISQLRDNLRQVDTKAKVAKKTLADLSFQKAGFNLNILNKKNKFNFERSEKKGSVERSETDSYNSIMFEFAFGDPILSAKTIWQFSKQNENLKILGALMDGKMLKTEEVIQLAQIPSREVLLGRLVASLASPIRNFNYLLNGNTRKLIYALEAIQN